MINVVYLYDGKNLNLAIATNLVLALLYAPQVFAAPLCPASSSPEVRDSDIKQCQERREKMRGTLRSRINAAQANYAKTANARTEIARSGGAGDCQQILRSLTDSNLAGQATMAEALTALQGLEREVLAEQNHFEKQIRKLRQSPPPPGIFSPGAQNLGARMGVILREHEDALRLEVVPYRTMIHASIQGGQASQAALADLNLRVGADGEACASLGKIAIDGSRPTELPPLAAGDEGRGGDGRGADGRGGDGRIGGDGGAGPEGGQITVPDPISPLDPSKDDSSGSTLPWLLGGAALLGGGTYLYISREDRIEDDIAAQKEWSSQLEEAAKKQYESEKSIPIPIVTLPNNTFIVRSDSSGTLYSPLEVAAQEMAPLELAFIAKGKEALQVLNLPKGALWDPATRIFRWLPGAGQNGIFEAQLQMGNTTQPLRILVAPRTPADLAKQAPPGHYRDGDIGYIFIHGAGGDKDRCFDSGELAAYWGSSPAIVAPDEANRKVACYDGRKAVANQAPRVAQQILDSSCGLFKKCILITHSMGGLLVEHMFTHARAATAKDPEPSMFANAELYRKVRERTHFVISIGSAAGGSKVSSILQTTKGRNDLQKVVGALTRALGTDNEAYKNLRPEYSSKVVAPLSEDPGVPFFMVGGYSKKTLREGQGVIDVLKTELIGKDAKIFHGESSLATIDYVTEFSSRSDGLVDFRSACGIADSSESGGPGLKENLDRQFQYCARQSKKPNHFMWFLVNLNHFDLTIPTYHCQISDNPCETHFNEPSAGTGFAQDAGIGKRSAVEVIRERLTRNRQKRVQHQVNLGF